MSRPVVLTFTRYYLPGYKAGGPIRSIANLVEELGDEYDFRIVTLDRDAMDQSPYPEILPNAWNAVGKAQVFYLKGSWSALTRIARLIWRMPFDVLYVNSILDPTFSTFPLVVRKLYNLKWSTSVIAAPRGEFSQGALALKAAKKFAFLAVARLLRIHNGLIWQASTIHERDDICRIMGSIADEVVVAPDMVVKTARQEKRVSRGRDLPLKVCFLSRISPMKNLDYALRVLQRVHKPVLFSIYGQDEGGGYLRLCRELAGELPPHVEVEFRGPIQHEEVAEMLQQQDLLFVPTRGENYGHVFIEALAAGVPILTSDQTPWRDLESIGIGWSLPLEGLQDFVDALEAAANWTDERRLEVSGRCLTFAIEHSNDGSAIEANRMLLAAATKGARHVVGAELPVV